MSDNIPEDKFHLLLVEGKEDQEFFIQLLQYTQQLTTVQIIQYGGKTKQHIQDSLLLRAVDPRFSQVRSMAIVVDADYEPGALNTVISAINDANKQNATNAFAFPVPDRARVFAGEKPSLGVLILPKEDAFGMLEDVVLDAFQGDAILRCVDDFMGCVSKHHQNIVEHNIPKARMNAFISGKNLGVDVSTGSDHRRKFLSDIFHMTWWKPELWERDVFKDIKIFLQTLATA